jgi:hypothetical protein
MPMVYADTGEHYNGFVLSGSHAQDEGLSPWADYGERDGAWVLLREVFPESPACGDTYMMTVHGSSGSYQTWYEFDGVEWAETGTTVPWQMRV